MRRLLNYQNTSLTEIIKKSERLDTLNHELKKHLAQELATNCRVANFNNGCLVIEVSNAALATRLRYETPELLRKFRSESRLSNLRSISYYIQGDSVQVPEKPRQSLSRKAADTLTEAAGKIKDPELEAALRRLASNVDK